MDFIYDISFQPKYYLNQGLAHLHNHQYLLLSKGLYSKLYFSFTYNY